MCERDLTSKERTEYEIERLAKEWKKMGRSGGFWWEGDSFVPFLHWLIDEHNFNKAHNIVNVVEKPYHYSKLWLEFNEKEK